jgi:hypothetical protein
VSSGLLLLGRGHLGRLFSGEDDVVLLTAQAVPPLAVSLIGGKSRSLSLLPSSCPVLAVIMTTL